MSEHALDRNRLVNFVASVAARCGLLDAAGQLGTLGLDFLRSARHEALCAGCSLLDVDVATLDGLDAGRNHVSRCGCGRVYGWSTWQRLPSCGELDDGGQLTDWRHCQCGSTLTLDFSA